MNKTRKKKKSIYVPNNELGITNWIPAPIKKQKIHDTDSWFNYYSYQNPKPGANPKYTNTVPIIPKESFRQQLMSIKRTKRKAVPVFIRSRKIRIYPTCEQKIILDEWFRAFSDMFNQTITYLRRIIGRVNIKSDFKAIKKLLSFFNIRKSLYDKKTIIRSAMENKMPAHILDEAINQAVANYKTCLTLMENGHIRKFRIREWSHNRRRKIIKIESSFFKKGTFCITTFPEMKASSDLTKVNSTATLQYNSDTKKYILLVPTAVRPNKVNKMRLSCGIDLGVRTFATVYSPNDTRSICNDACKTNQIIKYHKKIDKINELLVLSREDKIQIVEHRKKVGNQIITDLKTKELNSCKLKRALRKYHRKIGDMVKDMHFKVAHDLVNTYNKIYIGKLSTKGILSKNNVAISKKTKRMIGVLQPYAFRQKLIYMGHKYGSEVTEVDEYLTTKTCSNCGKLNELGSKKIHECKCGMKADRDENAAKNILKVKKEERERARPQLVQNNIIEV